MQIRTLAGSGAAALAVLVLAASPASAAEQQCQDYNSYHVCFSESGQLNAVSTPSGNFNTFSARSPYGGPSTGLISELGLPGLD